MPRPLYRETCLFSRRTRAPFFVRSWRPARFPVAVRPLTSPFVGGTHAANNAQLSVIPYWDPRTYLYKYVKVEGFDKGEETRLTCMQGMRGPASRLEQHAKDIPF